MPRGPRIDAPGLVHHVIVRGVDRRPIFLDDEDRHDFLARLDRILVEEGTRCLAWVLIANHVHLVLRRTRAPISRVMARVGTGFARRFNERHGRVGHLFQNRFLSRPIGDEGDLLGVIRYVHLNPVKHGVVADLAALARDPWCGHGALVGAREARAFHDSAEALAVFGSDSTLARSVLDQSMREGVAALVAAAEKATESAVSRRTSVAVTSDGGPSGPLDALVGTVAGSLGVGIREVTSASRRSAVVRARSLVASRAAAELGMPVAAIAAALCVSEATVRRAIDRARVRAPS